MVLCLFIKQYCYLVKLQKKLKNSLSRYIMKTKVILTINLVVPPSNPTFNFVTTTFECQHLFAWKN